MAGPSAVFSRFGSPRQQIRRRAKATATTTQSMASTALGQTTGRTVRPSDGEANRKARRLQNGNDETPDFQEGIMTGLDALWLPTLLSSLVVFVASSVITMGWRGTRATTPCYRLKTK